MPWWEAYEVEDSMPEAVTRGIKATKNRKYLLLVMKIELHDEALVSYCKKGCEMEKTVILKAI